MTRELYTAYKLVNIWPKLPLTHIYCLMPETSVLNAPG